MFHAIQLIVSKLTSSKKKNMVALYNLPRNKEKDRGFLYTSGTRCSLKKTLKSTLENTGGYLLTFLRIKARLNKN